MVTNLAAILRVSFASARSRPPNHCQGTISFLSSVSANRKLSTANPFFFISDARFAQTRPTENAASLLFSASCALLQKQWQGGGRASDPALRPQFRRPLQAFRLGRFNHPKSGGHSPLVYPSVFCDGALSCVRLIVHQQQEPLP